MRLSRAILIAVLAVGGFSAPARADYFVWEDAKSGLTVSYPDTWAMTNTRQPDDVLVLAAPSQGDDAVCRIRVRDDRRFLIYPPHMDQDVQAVAVSENFWNDYLNEYDNVNLYGHTDAAGLGKGYGSFAVTGYQGGFTGPKAERRGIAVAALYFGKIYVADCSSTATSFEKWQRPFLGLISSIDFKKAHHELWTGEYRNFLSDPGLDFKWPHSPVVTHY